MSAPGAVVSGPSHIYSVTGGTVVKNLPASAGNARHPGLIPGSGDPLEEEMTTHSSILAWEIPCAKEPGGLQSMGSHRVGQDLAGMLSLCNGHPASIGRAMGSLTDL